MTKKTLLKVGCLLAASQFLLGTTSKGQALYWDANDSTAGAGSATPGGTWGTDNFWSTDSTGASSTGAWSDNNVAVFAAGTDATGTYTVTNAANQTVTGINFEEGTVTISQGNLTLAAPAQIDVASGRSATISSIIGGTSGLFKTNSGTLTISANNTFSGTVVVGGGILSIPGETSSTAGAANPLGAAPGAATANSIIVSNNATLRSTKNATNSSFALPNRGITLGAGGGQFELTQNASADAYLSYGGIIAGSGTLTKKGNGTLYLTGVNTYTGNTTNLAGTLRIPSGSANIFGPPANGTLVLAGGNLSLPFDATRTIGNKLRMSANTTIMGNPTNSFRALSFSNNTVTTTGGTLTIVNSGGGTREFQVRFSGGGFTFSRPIVIGTNASSVREQLDFFTDIPTGDQTFSGVISGPGSVRRTCNGDGTGGRTILSGANTYAGGTFVNGGHLGFGSDSVGSPVTSGPAGTGFISVGDDSNDGFFASGGTRTVGNDISFSTGTKFTVNGTNALTLYGSLDLGTTAKTLNISNTALTTISGAIIGTGGGTTFTKTGPGTLALSGNNTFSGDIAVTGGELLANSATATSSGNVTVSSGATIGGTGNISGLLTVSGNIAPGADGVGQLTAQNNVDISGATYVWELGALKDDASGTAGVDFDQLNMTGGSITLGGSSTLSINFTNAATAPNSSNPFWQSTRTWKVVAINGSASNPGSANFATLLNANYTAGYFTNTVDGSGNVLLTFVPTAPPAAPVFNSAIVGAGTANTTLNWSAVDGVNYQVEYKNDLNDASWTVLGSVTASGSTASYTDTTGPVAKRFYRLVIP